MVTLSVSPATAIGSRTEQHRGNCGGGGQAAAPKGAQRKLGEAGRHLILRAHPCQNIDGERPVMHFQSSRISKVWCVELQGEPLLLGPGF